MNFRTRQSTRIRQGKPQNSTRVPVIIDKPASKKRGITTSEGNIEEVAPKTKTKSPITPVSIHTTRSVTCKKLRTQSAFEEEEKQKLPED